MGEPAGLLGLKSRNAASDRVSTPTRHLETAIADPGPCCELLKAFGTADLKLESLCITSSWITCDATLTHLYMAWVRCAMLVRGSSEQYWESERP